MNLKSIRQATHLDKAAINQLRISEFRRSSQFSLLKPEKLLWNSCDDCNIVLAAWDSKYPVATMRAVMVKNDKQAMDSLQCSVPREVIYPAIIFNSAATHLEYRKFGLNQALRYYFLLAAVTGRIKTIISPIYKGAPRIEFMKTLGYDFVLPKKNWQDKLGPKTDRILGLLKNTHLPQAITYIKTTRNSALSEFPWQGNPIVFYPDWGQEPLRHAI